MSFLEVAVAAPINHTLTYKAPDGRQDDVEPGMRLLVPLGRRRVTGYILTCRAETDDSSYTVRTAVDLLDKAPLFPADMVPFFRWLAEYYQYPIGEIIKGALPAGLSPQSGRTALLTDSGLKFFLSLPEKEKPVQPWFDKLIGNQKLAASSLRKIWRGKDRKLLVEWESAGLVEIKETLSSDSVREKKEVCVCLSAQEFKTDNLKKAEQKTINLLKEIGSNSQRRWIARRDVTREYSGARKALDSLETLGLITVTERNVYRNPFGERPPFYPEPNQLSGEQQKVLDKINPAIRQGIFCPFLLHGVTSSGKTEVYIRATAQTIAKGRGVLILVPEIALATQLEGNFLSRFGGQVAVLHSGLSAGERFDQWQRIMTGKANIVIGARSALFAPLADLGLIIVDEEHDASYKQEDNFRYQARDCAVLRGSQCQAVVILGSATPSITSFYHTTSGKYKLLTMKKRIADRQLPEVEIIDLKDIPTTSGRPPLFSPQLVCALKENFKQGNQSIIFLNRRGYASMVLCKECGNTIKCKHCNISLTLHQGRHKLICHYCGFSVNSAAVCPHCQSTELTSVGFGTERVESELRNIIPKAIIARLDRDTTSNKGDYLKILKAVHHRKIDILVGTQMITKGHHFPHVTLVGVVWADAGLGIPDYKASERTFQLLTQVFGRAGRGEKAGRVLVQTHHPGHYSISIAQTHNYNELYAAELKLREALQFPPFSRLVNIRIEGKSEPQVGKAAQNLAKLARKRAKSIKILGPAPAPIARLRDCYRWQLLLKGSNLNELHNLSSFLQSIKATALGTSAFKLSVDVDPENML